MHAHAHSGHSDGGRAHHHHGRRLGWALGLAAAYMVAEVIGGILSNSLALLADAGHMLTDVAAMGLGLFAIWVARRPASSARTYGSYRAEILAALANGATLVAVSIYIFIEAFQRFREPPEVMGATMLGIAIGGLMVNLIMMKILHGGHQENLNIRGVWLHVLGDAAGSVGTIAAGLLIWAWGWTWADPLASILIGVLIVISAWRLLQDSVAVLMEGTPGHIDLDEVRGRMLSLPGVVGVHDLHVWTIASNFVALSSHVVTARSGTSEGLLHKIRSLLQDEFSIEHVTIQVEPPEFTACSPNETCDNPDRPRGDHA